MQQFLDYLLTHPELIASAVLFVISLLTLFLKKKPKTIDEFLLCLGEVIEDLPNWIIEVERDGNGFIKKTAVLSAGLKKFRELYGRDLTDVECDMVETRISAAIEKILEAPHKKGD